MLTGFSPSGKFDKMLLRLTSSLSVVRHCVAQQARRNIGVSAAVMQKADLDPIQQLFVQKIREYADKSKTAGGKLVGATAEQENSLKTILEKIEKQFSATGKDMTQFPDFNFSDVTLESVGVDSDMKEDIIKEKVTDHEEEEDRSNVPFFDRA
ncbi:hypothetical protein ScPMuIL_002942 [Solemya velum]